MSPARLAAPGRRRLHLPPLQLHGWVIAGTSGDPEGGIYRPKGVGIDSEDHIYVVDGELGRVQVFDRRGRLLYRFGNGTNFGQFLLPAGLFIDRNDRVYLVDSYNRRVQVFQYRAMQQTATGAQQ